MINVKCKEKSKHFPEAMLHISLYYRIRHFDRTKKYGNLVIKQTILIENVHM